MDDSDETTTRSFSDDEARTIAARLLDAVRGEALEAAITAACDVVYAHWAYGADGEFLSETRSRKMAVDPLRNITQDAAQRIRYALDDVDITTREDHSAVFEALLELHSKRLGRAGLSFASDPQVAELMGKMVGEGETLADPACGFGGCLLAAARDKKRSHVIGVDVNEEAALFAQRRLELAGIDAYIKHRNWLDEEPTPGWDAVVAEPPMGTKQPPRPDRADATFARWGRSTAPDGDSLWLASIADSLKPTGRAVVLVADGIGFRSGHAERLREAMLSSGRVEAIICDACWFYIDGFCAHQRMGHQRVKRREEGRPSTACERAHQRTHWSRPTR